MAVTASAGVPFKSTHRVNSKMTISQTAKLDVATAKAQGQIKAPVTEQPEGEAVNYKRAGGYDYVSNSYVYAGTQSGKITIVYDNDGTTVWVKNILAGASAYFQTNSWVQGTLNAEGTLLTVPMGQSIYWDSGYEADVVLAFGSIVQNDEGKITIDVDETVTEVTYTVDPDAKTISLNGSIAPAEESSIYATGLAAYWTDDNSWSGQCEWNTVFTEDDGVAPTVITEQPEGELHSYFRTGDCIGSGWTGINLYKQDGKMNVVYNGDVAYIQNPLWWTDSYNSWVVGSYDATTGIISVPTGQYLSWNEEDEYGLQLWWGSSSVTEGEPDEEGNPTYSLNYAPSNAATIEFQVIGNTIELLNSIGDADAEFPDNYVATGMLGLWSDDQTMTSLEFNTMAQEVNLVPAVPADPVINKDASVAFYDSGEEEGYSRLYFTLPTTDVDGNMINPEYLSYSIFVDDNTEPFVFPAEDYTYDLDEDITEVPYSLYSNAVDFKSTYVYIYRTNAEGFEPFFTQKVGIQVYYTVDDVRNASNIVWSYLNPVAIENVKVDSNAKTGRFNILGQPVDSNYRGFVIENGKKLIVR